VKDTRQNFRLIGDSEVIRLGIVRIGPGKWHLASNTTGQCQRVPSMYPEKLPTGGGITWPLF
jgi:hypothetical protein